jgi:predicted O-linked N-acetylglucosamine transferase (SPINDLY family)
MALIGMRQDLAALQSFDLALRLDPSNAVTYNNRGIALSSLGQFEAAAQSLSKAIELGMQQAATFNNLAIALFNLKRFTEAISNYQKAFELNPDHPNLRGGLLNARTHICDWSNRQAAVDEICARVTLQQNVVTPFEMLAAVDSPPLHQITAQVYAKTKCPANPTLGAIALRKPTGRIRLGYFSADFHNHATAYLMAEMFERHDRSQFELIAFSFGPEAQDAMRTRLTAAFDQFVDARLMPELEIARLSRQMGIDIAVDLKGNTEDCRTGIFAARAAPVQVSYLGYPGSMGVDYMDYILADTTVIPEGNRQHYTEKVVCLPHCYQVNDRQRKVSERRFSLSEVGLPETGFVFCCFNNNYKITPPTFDGWMRILQRVEDSVLWLLQDNPLAAENLRKEAQARGVSPQRLVFAQRMPLDEHLARQKLADLFIDTLPYNAHTTTSDALWAGLPVLTCAGESFASRVAASLLKAIGLPELVTHSQQDFEDLAVELASQPQQLAAIREKLARNRLTTPLFDTELFTRNIEQAYKAMHQRHVAGLPPEHIILENGCPIADGVQA